MDIEDIGTIKIKKKKVHGKEELPVIMNHPNLIEELIIKLDTKKNLL